MKNLNKRVEKSINTLKYMQDCIHVFFFFIACFLIASVLLGYLSNEFYYINLRNFIVIEVSPESAPFYILTYITIAAAFMLVVFVHFKRHHYKFWKWVAAIIMQIPIAYLIIIAFINE